MKSCSGSLLKLIVFGTNLAFMLFSVLLIVYSACSIGQLNAYHRVIDDSYAPYVSLIVVGSLLLLVTFFACCGAFMENTCLLNGFAYIVAALVLVEVGSFVVVYRNRANIKDAIVDAGQELVAKDYATDPAVQDFIDNKVQQAFQCCGIQSADDWDSFVNKTGQYPLSCCQANKKTCKKPDFKKACGPLLTSEVGAIVGTLLTVLGAFVFLQVVSLSMACALASAIRHDYFRIV
ncbi:CD63 antigen [Halotydeus destructor]|nr:CD63 antigen [Halotydeus destructor]